MATDLNQVQWESAKIHGRIVAKAWADPEFKEKLLANPHSVLREGGIDVSADMEVYIKQDSSYARIGNVIHFGLPDAPDFQNDIEQLSPLGGGPGADPQTTQTTQTTGPNCFSSNCTNTTGPQCGGCA